MEESQQETPAVEPDAPHPAEDQARAPAPAEDAAPQGDAPTPEPEDTSRQVPAPAEGQHYFWGTGRRKSAVARVRIRPGTGKILVNKRQVDLYFHHQKDQQVVAAPLETAHMATSWDIWANVSGGGTTGQAGAIRMGLARAIAKAVPDVERDLRDQGHLTRDARMKERKKPGQPGARKRFQFSKR